MSDDLTRGAVAVYTPEDLKRKLAFGRPLRVKLGVDPTAPDIHLGHTVVLRKLRAFQDAGHQAVLIVGDFTALVGDPSGKSKTRPQLSEAQVEVAAKTYVEQVGAVLDLETLEIRRNSEWLRPLDFGALLKLAGLLTAAQLLEREDFKTRYTEGKPIGMHEFMYVMMQAYDSVAIRADVELGGTDQTFNLVTARDFMRAHGMEPQVAMTMPILRGLDGTDKMSKSLGNYIGVAEPAIEMYSKAMRIPDALLEEWTTLLTSLPYDASAHPMEMKKRVARAIVEDYRPGGGDAAAAEWERVVSRKEAPSEIPELRVPPTIGAVDLLMLTEIPKSRGDARRLIEQGGVELDGERIGDVKAEIAVRDGAVLRVGKKRRHFRLSR